MRCLISLIIAMLLPTMAHAEGTFAEKDVKVYNPYDKFELGGTMTYPAAGQPKASIILATGSGNQNRDEEIAGKRPFKTIAEFLSKNGYAVFRFDDRGVGESGGARPDLVNDDFARDIELCTALADSLYPGVPVGLLGHSEGGLTVIKNAVRNPRCSFIITLASPAMPLDTITLYQVRKLAEATGQQKSLEQSVPRVKARYEMAKSTMPIYALRTNLYIDVMDELGEMANIPQVKQQVEQQIDMMTSPWYRDLLRYDPATDITTVKVPWLALNGDKDMQVSPDNLQLIGELNPSADCRLLPSHNHLFQQCVTGLPNEYAALPGDVSEETLAEILKWLDDNF